MAKPQNRLSTVTRRRLVQGSPLAWRLSEAKAHAGERFGAPPSELLGPVFDLTVEGRRVNITGRERTCGRTAELYCSAGQSPGGVTLAAGLRSWF